MLMESQDSADTLASDGPLGAPAPIAGICAPASQAQPAAGRPEPARAGVTAAPDGLEQPDRVWVFGLPLVTWTLQQTVDAVDRLVQQRTPSYFITANLHYAMLTDRYPKLREVNRRAAFLVADGMPLVWYSRLTSRPLPERVTGADLIYPLCQRAAERGYRVFFLGGAPGVGEAAAERLIGRFHALRVAGTAAPELDTLSSAEHTRLIATIRDARPDLLFVAFGQPKGEFWLAEHCQELAVPVSVQVGAAFDFVAGRAFRAPRIWRRLGLEWLYRLLREPRRLGPRYLRNALFLFRAAARDMVRGGLVRPVE